MDFIWVGYTMCHPFPQLENNGIITSYHIECIEFYVQEAQNEINCYNVFTTYLQVQNLVTINYKSEILSKNDSIDGRGNNKETNCNNAPLNIK